MKRPDGWRGSCRSPPISTRRPFDPLAAIRRLAHPGVVSPDLRSPDDLPPRPDEGQRGGGPQPPVRGEEVLATGRCADITTTGDLDSAGAAWTYVMVTDRRLLWAPSIRKIAATCSLDLDAIRRCNEVHWRHRCAMAMHHDPLVRRYFAPNGRQRNWEYTSMDVVVGRSPRRSWGSAVRQRR